MLACLTDKNELQDASSAAHAVVQHAVANPGLPLLDYCLGMARPNTLIPIRNGRSYPDFRVEEGSEHALWCSCPVGTHGGGGGVRISSLMDRLLLTQLPLGAVSTKQEEQFWESAIDIATPSSFGGWISGALSRVVTDTFIQTNPNISRLEVRATKSPDAFLTAVQLALQESLIVGAGSIVKMLAAQDLEVVLGWTEQPLSMQIDGLSPGARFTTGHEHALSLSGNKDASTYTVNVKYPAAIRGRIHGRSRAQNGYHSAPYFYAAMGKRVGDDLHAGWLFLHPVQGLPYHVTLTESGPEGEFASLLRSARLPYFKPPRLADTNRLLARITALGSQPLVLQYRPDFLVFDQRAKVMFIIEVAGRRDPNYLAGLKAKMAYYDSIETNWPVIPLRFDADNLPDREGLMKKLADAIWAHHANCPDAYCTPDVAP